jgi:phthiocerol/phenolphthiocerol synthesis type-I polyketide synthase E
MSTQTDHLNHVAIVGMAARLPGAGDLDQFWSNLRDGVESVTFLTPEPPVIRRGLGHVKAVPRLEGMELFDASFFGFNPREAETMDPQIRLFLECAWHALEAAGCDPAQYPGRIGVFAGCGFSTYLTGHLLANPEVMRAAGSGLSSVGQFNDRDALTTVVSYKLDLTGPAVTVQTFCSTSLVAVHLACQSLLNGESDLVLAGGSSVNPASANGYVYQEGGILSPDGHTRTFDEKAGGTVFGSGVGVVVLKRLEDALADGDVVHAVIRGSAINNDGAQKAGYTAPSVIGQSKAIAEAMAVAQVHPEAVSYVEAHGTATALGDPIEIEALGRAYRLGTARKGFCSIGSVKTNFGHLDRAAGVAALIKTVLALKHRQIPPSLHFEQPNPKLDLANSPFVVNTRLREWERKEGPRIAGVSALGVGGTNAHVIVEEAPEREASGGSRSAQLLVLSARTEPALEQATDRLVAHLRAHPEQPLADVAFTLLAGRHRFEHRRSLAAATAAEAAALLEARDPQRVATSFSRATERPVVFMFPGQGAQYPGMTRGLYEGEPSFRHDVDACCERLLGPVGLDLRRVLFPEAADGEAAEEQLRRTALTQPALFVVEYALARLWMSWGVIPQAMIGHSIGEYVAAHLAGVMSLEDALALVAERGRLMQSLPPGAMLAVSLPPSELEGLVREPLSIAAVNSPGLCVVSGPPAEVGVLEEGLRGRDVFTARLHTSHAFHSAMMDPILDAFRERVETTKLVPPGIPYVSNLTGTWIEASQATDAGYWVDHLRRTVRFSDGVATLWSEPERILLEVGPGNALSNLARQQPGVEAERLALPTVRHRQDPQSDLVVLGTALGRLWGGGAAVDAHAFFAGQRRQRVELPRYPFERQRFWVDPPSAGAAAAGRGEALRRDPAEWFYLPAWRAAPPPRLFDGQAREEGDWLVFTDSHGAGTRIADRLRAQGVPVVVVEMGESFAGGPAEGFRIDPPARGDYDRLLESLEGAGRKVTHVVHGWAIDSGGAPSDPRSGWERGYYSLFALAQALATRRWSHTVWLSVLASHQHEVLKGDVVRPEKATLLGLVKVIPQEQHNVRCISVDVEPAGSPTWRDAAAVDALVEELRADVPGVVAAYRGGQRFVQGFDRLRLPAPAERPARLREQGAYLVTGGLGGVTFVLAAYLARTVKARLALTGRSLLPPAAEWDQWLATHGDADPTSVRIGRARRLESLGAEVLVLRADAGDLAQMQAALAEAEARFGRIHGVIHGAGIVGGGTFRPLSQLGRRECEEQFHPKVKGLEVLDQVLEGRELDFCLLTSSLSSVLGGFGYGAYAAANLYMDAFVRARRREASPWISVNWDEWRLAAPGEDGPDGGGLARFAMAPAEGAAAFARILGLRGVPQVVVSTGDLEARIDQWVRLEGLLRAKEAAEAKKTAPRHARPNLHNAYVAPSTPTEETVAAVWAELLGLEKVGIHDNFFELGGHSLLAIQMVTEIRTRLSAEVSVATLFEGPTVHSLSRLIVPEAAAEPAEADQSRERGERRKEESRRRQAARERSLR